MPSIEMEVQTSGLNVTDYLISFFSGRMCMLSKKTKQPPQTVFLQYMHIDNIETFHHVDDWAKHFYMYSMV